VVFRKVAELRRLYPRLVHHGMTTFASTDVMRYLGRRTYLTGEVRDNFSGEVVSNLKARQEGVRIKHSVNGNSVKLYDKAFTVAGSVLRAETTIQNGRDFRVYRAKEGHPDGPKAWRVLRRGIADIHRRADLSKKRPKDTSTPLPPWTTTPPSKNSSAGSKSTPSGMVNDCGRCIRSLMTVRCWPPSRVASLPSAGSATATCKPFSSPLQPRRRERLAAVQPGLPESSDSSALTA
jgi:hypothetical protein